MLFEDVSVGGCRSYLIGCGKSCAAAVIDPEISQIDRYRGLAARDGLTIRYVIDTHTHADHFSAAREIAEALGAQVVMHADAPAPFVDLRLEGGQSLHVGEMRVGAIHTPGHTADSMCLTVENKVFTGDTLLINGTGRTDLPTGDPAALYDSLFGKLLRLDPKTEVWPAHVYKGPVSSTIGAEIANNPRLQKTDRAEFVSMMAEHSPTLPTHLTEALRVNMTGKRSVARMLAEAAAGVPFVSLDELARRIEGGDNDLVVLDVREKEAYEAGHIPGAVSLPRGQLELKVDDVFPDPTVRILTCCEFGKISTLAAATLRDLGFVRTAALDGGFKAWKEAGRAVE